MWYVRIVSKNHPLLLNSAAAKKKLRSKIALREAAEAQADEDLTEEEKASAKMHAMKMEEQAQMSLTRDMFGECNHHNSFLN